MSAWAKLIAWRRFGARESAVTTMINPWRHMATQDRNGWTAEAFSMRPSFGGKKFWNLFISISNAASTSLIQLFKARVSIIKLSHNTLWSARYCKQNCTMLRPAPANHKLVYKNHCVSLLVKKKKDLRIPYSQMLARCHGVACGPCYWAGCSSGRRCRRLCTWRRTGSTRRP